MVITFERNIVGRAVTLQVERGDFGGSKTLPFAQIARSKPFQKRAEIWFAPKNFIFEQAKCREFFEGVRIELLGQMRALSNRQSLLFKPVKLQLAQLCFVQKLCALFRGGTLFRTPL